LSSQDVILLQSLIDYVNDVKPYHSKLKEFLSELQFAETANVNVRDKKILTIYHQNQWGRDDVGGYQLFSVSEGTDADRYFRIPAAVWPRVSLNDRLQYGQTPPGDDPATNNKSDYSPHDGRPDVEEPWSGARSESHFMGSDHDPADPTKYYVPFHQGSRVYVDGTAQVFGVDYSVDYSRSFIKFGIAPADSSHIDVQLLKVDRLFITYTQPFDYEIDRDYDDLAFDIPPYDSDDDVHLSDADYFEFTIDHTAPSGHTPVGFHNSVPSNSSKPTLTILNIGSSAVNGDVWRVTAIAPMRCQVQKTYPLFNTEPIGYVDFKQTFTNSEISFILDGGWADYYLVPDDQSYEVLQVDNVEDPTDFQVNLNVVSEHGVVTDLTPPIQRPMELMLSPTFSLGKIMRVSEETLNGPQEYYSFVLSSIPSRGTYVELRIEQNGQLNPWIMTAIGDDLYIDVIYGDTTSRLIHYVRV
jgi:hypothetical protein